MQHTTPTVIPITSMCQQLSSATGLTAASHAYFFLCVCLHIVCERDTRVLTYTIKPHEVVCDIKYSLYEIYLRPRTTLTDRREHTWATRHDKYNRKHIQSLSRSIFQSHFVWTIWAFHEQIL